MLMMTLHFAEVDFATAEGSIPIRGQVVNTSTSPSLNAGLSRHLCAFPKCACRHALSSDEVSFIRGVLVVSCRRLCWRNDDPCRGRSSWEVFAFALLNLLELLLQNDTAHASRKDIQLLA